MRTTRIYLPVPLREGATVELDERARRHAVTVLRLRAGDELTLFNGEGGEWRARLEEVSKRSVRARIGQALAPAGDTESPLRITLLQGISRGERMDFTIQKAVELGVSRIAPVVTERTQVRLSGERLERRLHHWRGVLIHACEQCGRDRLPLLETPRPLAEALAESDEPGLLLDPRGDRAITDLPQRMTRVRLLIGPEGGLSDRERSMAREASFEGLRLGPRILRTETAALAAIAALQACLGDFRS